MDLLISIHALVSILDAHGSIQIRTRRLDLVEALRSVLHLDLSQKPHLLELCQQLVDIDLVQQTVGALLLGRVRVKLQALHVSLEPHELSHSRPDGCTIKEALNVF